MDSATATPRPRRDEQKKKYKQMHDMYSVVITSDMFLSLFLYLQTNETLSQSMWIGVVLMPALLLAASLRAGSAAAAVALAAAAAVVPKCIK
jgi:hypothetical protein